MLHSLLASGLIGANILNLQTRYSARHLKDWCGFDRSRTINYLRQFGHCTSITYCRGNVLSILPSPFQVSSSAALWWNSFNPRQVQKVSVACSATPVRPFASGVSLKFCKCHPPSILVTTKQRSDYRFNRLLFPPSTGDPVWGATFQLSRVSLWFACADMQRVGRLCLQM